MIKVLLFLLLFSFRDSSFSPDDYKTSALSLRSNLYRRFGITRISSVLHSTPHKFKSFENDYHSNIDDNNAVIANETKWSVAISGQDNNATGLLRLAARNDDKKQNVTSSADKQFEAYTIDGNLYISDTQNGIVNQITSDGNNLILNGYASWVYYEEIFGRASNYKAFWWSPDSKKLAFYRFDQSLISEFPIYSPFGQNGSLNLTRYPKAGQLNPEVRIGIYNLEDKSITWADFDYSIDGYFGTPFWSDDSSKLYVQTMPRRQNHLDLYAVTVNNGQKSKVYTEDYSTWLEWISGMLFSPDGLYMVRSFESGWEQIYFLGYDGTLKRLTDGQNWDTSLLKLDKNNIYFTSKRDSRVHRSLYRLDKKGKVICLSNPDYNISNIKFEDKKYTATLQNGRTPQFKIEGRCDKNDIKILERSQANNDIPSPEIVTITNDDYTLYGLMSKPKFFDPNKKYPVVMYVYGGPGTSYMRDDYGRSYDKWCYENEVIYIICNPRSSGENGVKGMDEAFRQMTVIELEDFKAWANWLKSLPFVQGDRIGVTGFSFGGTTTTMLVLRYPELFHCGIAGGGVYDWTLYDSHYTERFMDTPSANPEGYKIASPLYWIDKIDFTKVAPGALLLTHGTGDDNVHFQNTLLLIDALQKVNYQFDLMIYPDGMHGYRGSQAIFDNTMNAAFWTKWLLE